MKRGITDEALKLVYADLEALSKKAKITPVREAIKHWEVVIRHSLKQGYTYADVCEVISRRGIKVAPATLKQYLAELEVKREEQTQIKRELNLELPAEDLANDASVMFQKQPSTPGVVAAEKAAEKPVPEKAVAVPQPSAPLQQQKLGSVEETTTTITTRISAANAAANSQKKVVAISAKGRREIPVPTSQTRDASANSGSGSPLPNSAIE